MHSARDAFFFGGGKILESTLYALIELQEIDIKLDKVDEERGDLPERVQDINDEIHEKESQLITQKEQIKKLKVENGNLELELNSSKAQLQKYQNQLYQVKTNKEYDAIANETENVKRKIDEYENKIIETSETIEKLDNSNKDLQHELKTLRADLAENDSELQAKIGASAEEENILRQERQIVESKLTQQQLSAYERIRGAKDGRAVAYCNGGVCSGCFSFIPPQKVVEIRSMKRLYYCESCGRILVWDKNVE